MSNGNADEPISALLERAESHLRGGRRAEAAELLRAAVRLDPRRAAVHYRLGCALDDSGEIDAAGAAFALAAQLAPDFADAHFALSHTLERLGRLEDAIAANRRALALDPGCVAFHNSLVYRLHHVADREALREELRRWSERHAGPLSAQWQAHAHSRDPERPLKIGYVSNYFREHATAFFLHPLLAHHDRKRFQVVAYSGTKSGDEVTGRFRTLVQDWREIATWDDARVAAAVREDRIDILVDGIMHMAGCRLLVFARKPAPVQVTWVAYPGSTGLEAIDYRISDRHLDPAEEDDRYYAEKTVRLPDSFWCYDPLTTAGPVGPLPAAATGHFTFGCLNELRKVNEPTLEMWARVLRSVAGSRLLLLAPPGAARRAVGAIFEQHGVAPSRIEFVGSRARADYLALYHRVDLALAPFPFCGHTTICDALWMGVPTVTLTGNTPVSRGGKSLLHAAGLPQFVAASAEDYVRIAAETADNLAALATLRAGLRRQMEASRLMDGPRFAANMEAAYRAMWRRWCAEGSRGLAPS